jgi:hypothetical protein
MKNAFEALAPFVRREIRCEVCAAPIGESHAHVVSLKDRTLACACGACAVLFRYGGERYRTVPDRVKVTDASGFDAIPVQLAFVVRQGERWSTFYPSPAGAVEAAVPGDVLAALPFAADLDADVEALLVRRPRAGAPECWLVGIDVCHQLTALLRRKWRGFSGGDEVAVAVDEFFARLREKIR